MTALTPEIVDELAYLASLAPSPHNAQGWRLSFTDDTFSVRLDKTRQVLGKLDPLSLEGELACGAVVANLSVAASSFGRRAEIRWRPRAEVMATVRLTPSSDPPSPLAPVLTRRAVNRSRYHADRPVPPDEQRALQQIAERHGFALRFVTERVDIDRVADLVGKAGRIKLAHDETQRELVALFRFSEREAARKRDGLALDLFFVPRVLRALAPALLHPRFIAAMDRFGYAAQLAKANEAEPVRSASALCLLVAEGGTADPFLRGGEVFELLALRAALANLALQPHSAPIEVGLRDEHADPEVAEIRRGLHDAFRCDDRVTPIAFFRLGYATRHPVHRSQRRPIRDILEVERRSGEPAFYEELTTRNRPSIADDDQEAIRRSRFLFAGCGSIGGAPIEVMARLGAESFVLAEPGSYEMNNLNRQAATLADIGRNKAEVHRDRILAVNPHAEVLVHTSGVTAQNVSYLVGSSDVIIDGVDVTEPSGIRAKRLLHEEAFRHLRPVVIGLDLGGTQLLRFYDYRSGRVKPLDGRFPEPLDEELTGREFLSRILSPVDVPLDLVKYAEMLLRGSDAPAPQLSPTATLFGALAAWAAFELAAGRKIRREVKVDGPGMWMPVDRRISRELQRWVGLVRLQRLLSTRR